MYSEVTGRHSQMFQVAIPKFPGLKKPRQHIKLGVMSSGLNHVSPYWNVEMFLLHKLAYR